MAGEYAALTVKTHLNAGSRLVGIEALQSGGFTLDQLEGYLVAARETLRERAASSLDVLYATYGVSEIVFFDTVAALGSSSTGAAATLYWHLIRLLSYETLAGFYADKEGRAGRKTATAPNKIGVPLSRAEKYAGLAGDGLPRLARLTEEAEANDEIDLTAASDIDTREDHTVWIA